MINHDIGQKDYDFIQTGHQSIGNYSLKTRHGRLACLNKTITTNFGELQPFSFKNWSNKQWILPFKWPNKKSNMWMLRSALDPSELGWKRGREEEREGGSKLTWGSPTRGATARLSYLWTQFIIGKLMLDLANKNRPWICRGRVCINGSTNFISLGFLFSFSFGIHGWKWD